MVGADLVTAGWSEAQAQALHGPGWLNLPTKTSSTADSPFAAILGDRLQNSSAAERRHLDNINDFSQALGRPEADPHKSAAARAREGAEQLVATAFLTPLLKDFRAGSWAEGPFKPTQAERMFRSVGDAEVARSIVQRGGFSLVDAVARRLLANTPGVETPGGSSGGDKPAENDHSKPADGKPADAQRTGTALCGDARAKPEPTGDPALDGRIALERARDAARGIDSGVPRSAGTYR